MPVVTHVPNDRLVVVPDRQCPESDFFGRLITDLENLASTVDALDADLEAITLRIMSKAGRQVSGVGFVAVAIKASTLSAKLDRLVKVLRRNEARRWARQ